MKKIILIGVILIIARSSFAQQYFPQPELKKFVGTWGATVNNQVFKIALEIRKVLIKGSTTSIDMIEGYHSYTLDSKIIESSFDSGKPSIYSGSIANKEKSLTIINCLFYDLVKKKTGDGHLELVPGKTDEMLWTLTNTEGVRAEAYDYSFSVPLKLTLRKLK